LTPAIDAVIAGVPSASAGAGGVGLGGAIVFVGGAGADVVSAYVYEPESAAKSYSLTFGGSMLMLIATNVND
jgi:hypothetical protein